jgi:DNA-binding response OmpR family regulator
MRLVKLGVQTCTLSAAHRVCSRIDPGRPAGLMSGGERIVVIDDDEDFLEQLGEALVLCGYEVQTFAGGEPALLEIRRACPDMVLLDLRLNEDSGFRLAERVRQLPGTENLPIIAMTGYYTQPEHGDLVRICGMQALICKPFGIEELVSRIEEILM